jgi:hypothetical protein
MRKRRYSGILRRPLVRDPSKTAQEQAYAQLERILALFEFYGIAPFTENCWKELAEALATAHVPGFSYEKPRHKERQRAGNKQKLSPRELLIASLEVIDLKERKKWPLQCACDHVWKIKYKDKCKFETFRQNMRLIGNIEADQLLRPQQGDDSAIKSFKQELWAMLIAASKANPDKVRADLEHFGWQFEIQD